MPAKLAGYFKRNKETSAKLRETIIRSKKYPANFPALGRGPFFDERKEGKRKSRQQGRLPS